MNIYHILTEEVLVFQEVVADRNRYEYGQVFNLVAARTCCQAKALFVRANHRDVDWTTPMTIKCIGSLDCAAGIIEDSDHPAWHLLPDYDDYLALSES